MINAVIFDFDGVIGDTMADNFRAWKNAFSSYGVEIQPLDYYLLEGMGRFEIARHFIDKYDLDLLVEQDVVSAKEQFYKLNNSFKVYNEIYDIFQLLSINNIKTAIVTGASRNRINETLDRTILNQLSVLVTADDVVNVKPHPEPYLTAIKKLGISASNCMVIENAKLGIQSAKAAGCICFAIETTLDKTYLIEADETFPNHLSISMRFKEMFNS